MVMVQLEPELEARLEELAAHSQVSSSFYAHEAILRFVEDREDYLAGIRALGESRSTISLAELERLSDVAD
jgi:predicted transcriptional regulator